MSVYSTWHRARQNPNVCGRRHPARHQEHSDRPRPLLHEIAMVSSLICRWEGCMLRAGTKSARLAGGWVMLVSDAPRIPTTVQVLTHAFVTQASHELTATYAALILADDNIEITVRTAVFSLQEAVTHPGTLYPSVREDRRTGICSRRRTRAYLGDAPRKGVGGQELEGASVERRCRRCRTRVWRTSSRCGRWRRCRRTKRGGEEGRGEGGVGRRHGVCYQSFTTPVVDSVFLRRASGYSTSYSVSLSYCCLLFLYIASRPLAQASHSPLCKVYDHDTLECCKTAPERIKINRRKSRCRRIHVGRLTCPLLLSSISATVSSLAGELVQRVGATGV